MIDMMIESDVQIDILLVDILLVYYCEHQYIFTIITDNARKLVW